MKPTIEKLLRDALHTLAEKGVITESNAVIQIEQTRDKQHGDYASNIALTLAKAEKKKPAELAKLILDAIPPSDKIQKVQIAGPGFINFFLQPEAHHHVIKEIHQQKSQYGYTKIGREKKILLEFLSSNPTGPLHVGHGRLAAFGAVLANLLRAVGFQPFCEYYVNDAGRQMDIVTVSVWIRYLQLMRQEFPFPANGYHGEYIFTIAKNLQAKFGNVFAREAELISKDLPLDEQAGGDKEKYIDALIEKMKALTGDAYHKIFDFACSAIMADIKTDLADFGVHYDNWFSEKTFIASKSVEHLLNQLKASGHTYEREGALWFRSTDFGDTKDRVLIRSNGQYTYFTPDAAYHLNKFERGFDIALDIFGSDHHGYTARMRAAMQAAGINPERLIIILMQFVSLFRGKEPISMSTRAGQFITLRELRQEVGNDAARFFYLMRKSDQHVDFDLELAKSKSNENPVYYVQYAHARICSVFKQLHEQDKNFFLEEGLKNLSMLNDPKERDLMATLAKYPEVIINAAINYEPHLLTHYLREVAADFHAYYNAQQFIVEDADLRNARLALIAATRIVLVNGFTLLGISAPETM